MFVKYSFLLWVLLVPVVGCAQNGKIVSKQPYPIPDSIFTQLAKRNPELVTKLKTVNFYRLTYLSDGLKVTAYSAEPKAPGKYPCIISNRGGNREFGQWDALYIARFLGEFATWNYVVIASQYRGNDGGEGKEEFGGKDVNDVLNLIPALAQFPNADTARMGIEGGSRGGTMTYLALKNSCRFKAAVVTAGMANAYNLITARPDMETGVLAELIPDYQKNKKQELENRSAVFWVDKLCKTTPLLIMHGSADWRVQPTEAFELVQKLYAAKHPTRFILFEGTDHGISEFRTEHMAQIKRHFDYYLRDGKPLPNLAPHGF